MSIKLSIIRRFILVYLLLLTVAVAVVVQMVRLVLFADVGKAGGVIVDTRTIPANRGNILAHDGRLLATSIYKYRLFTDLNASGLTNDVFNKNVDSLAKGLSLILGEKSAAEYSRELRADRQKALNDPTGKTFRYRPLSRRDIDHATLRRLQELPILRSSPNRGGLIIDKRIHRIHPIDDMARNTVGRINAEGQGTSGIERYYNKELAGRPGIELMRLTTTWVPMSSTPQKEPVDGSDIVSTIDIDMQDVAENVIKEHLRRNPDLEWGTAVIMEVKTGEVRAIVNKRKAANGRIIENENYALYYRKDPGSTFKLASFIIMLERGLSLTDSVDTDRGWVRLYDKIFEDEGSTGGVMSVQEVFEKSSNVGTVKLAQKMYSSREQRRDFSERIEALRFKKIVNYDMQRGQRRLPPLIKSHSEFSGLTLPMMSIGYELEITPLQTLTLYNAVANNGVMVHPRFLREIRHRGEVVRRFGTQTISASICSERTLEKLHQMLVGVVEHGTGTRAQSSSFGIAGKTGTAHIAEGHSGYTNQKLSSFAGYFPACAPRYSAIVVFKTYETQNKSYGGIFAAPAFRHIAEKVYAISTDWHEPITEHHQMLPMTARSHNVVQGVVPNVQGMSIQDALYLLENAGLRVRFSGRGAVRTQSLLPGSTFRQGEVVALTLTNNS